MSNLLKVTAPAVVVRLAGGGESYHYRGSAIPAEVLDADHAQRLVADRMLARMDANGTEIPLPETDEVDGMTDAELKKYAAEHEIDITAATNRAQRVEAVKTARKGS